VEDALKRRTREHYDHTTYPTIRTLPDRRTVVRGLLAGAATIPATWLIGCPGGIDDGDWGMDTVQLPPAPSAHSVTLADGGTLEYRVVATVRGDVAYYCLETNDPFDQQHLLSVIDEVLSPHATGDFADGQSLANIEAEIVLRLHEECDGYEEPHELFLALDLVIEDLEAGSR